MPKLKTRKSAAKRFRLTKKGHIKRTKAGKGHILTKKSRKRKNKLAQGGYVDSTQVKTLKRLLPYG